MLVINFKGKTPQQNFYSIGVKDNNKANKIMFVLSAYQQDVNLGEYTPYLKVQSKEHDYIDKIVLESTKDVISDDILNIVWTLTSKSTQYRNLELQLQFQSDNNDEVVWQTMIVEIELSETIKADKEVNEKYPTELAQLEKEVASYSGRIEECEEKVDEAVLKTDIVDNLDSEATNKPLSAKQGKTLNDKINTAISSVMTYKGSVQSYEDLPTQDVKVGDFYNVIDDDSNYAWTGEEWDKVGSAIDTSNLVDKTSDQYISGEKAFIKWVLKPHINSSRSWQVAEASDTELDLQKVDGGNTSILMKITELGLATDYYIPLTDNGGDLGISTKRWRDLYLAGNLTDGTNSFSIANIVNTNTAQRITAPKSFFNNRYNDTLPLRIQGFENKTWGLEMDKDFGRLHFKFANVSGTNISYIVDHLVLDSSALYPAQNNVKDLGTSAYTWKDLYLGNALKITSASNTFELTNAGNYIAFKLGATTLADWGSSGLAIRTHIYPSTTGKDLGQSTNQWRDFYISGAINLSKTGETTTYTLAEQTGGSLLLSRSGIGVMSFASTYFSSYNHRPIADNTYDLGSSTTTWKDIYLSGSSIYKDGSGASTRLWKIQCNNWGTLDFYTSNDGGATWGNRLSLQSAGLLPTSSNMNLGLGNGSQRWKTLYVAKISDGNNNEITPKELHLLNKSIQGLAQSTAVSLNDGDTLTDQPTIYMMSQHLPVMINNGMCYFLTEDTNYYVYTTHTFDSSTLEVVPYKIIVNKTTFAVVIGRI